MINVNNAKGNANDLNIVVQVPQQDDIQIRKVTWLGKAVTNTFNWINGTSFTAILKVYGVIFVFLTLAMMSFVAYKIASNDNALLQVTNSLVVDREKIEREAIRDDIVTPRIQEALTRIVYATNVDRICIFEFHNGKENASGLPFRYADMSYEEIGDGMSIDKVGMNCQNIPLNLFKFPYYLQQNNIFIGTSEELNKIDKDFANGVMGNGGKYIAAIYLSSHGVSLGFIWMSFHSMENVPPREELQKKLEKYRDIFAQYLDLTTHKNDKK